MMTAPNSWACTLHIREIREDTGTPGKFHVAGEILSAPEAVKDNTFFAIGRQITGFSFSLPVDIKPGDTVNADVEFMGDPFVQNYQLTNVERVA